MNTYYILFVIVFIQLSLKYGTAQVIAKTDKCEGGEKVQYGHHFECICPTNWVHESPKKCVDKTKLSECKDASSVDKVCGDFAVCKESKTSAGTYECTCIDKFSAPLTKGKSLKANEGGCIATDCLSKQCGNGVCRLGLDDKPMCSCKIGHVRDTEATADSKCSKVGDKQECTLECPKNSTCFVNEAGYYHCKCTDGKIVVDGECSSGAFNIILSPLNLIFILVVSFISLKSA